MCCLDVLCDILPVDLNVSTGKTGSVSLLVALGSIKLHQPSPSYQAAGSRPIPLSSSMLSPRILKLEDYSLDGWKTR